MFEHRHQPLLPFPRFLHRQLRHAGFAFCIVLGSLGIGISGYHFLDNLSWTDALLNASMILGGMGPVDPLHSSSAKLFASFYALYSGVVFLVVVGILFAPFLHRIFHKFHLQSEDDNEKEPGSRG